MIFDTSPVLVVTDASVLGRQVDGALLVADAGGTREQALAQTVDELRKTGVNILGSALNRLDSRSRGYYYYYYTDEGRNHQRRSDADGGNGPRFRLPWQEKTA